MCGPPDWFTVGSAFSERFIWTKSGLLKFMRLQKVSFHLAFDALHRHPLEVVKSLWESLALYSWTLHPSAARFSFSSDYDIDFFVFYEERLQTEQYTISRRRRL